MYFISLEKIFKPGYKYKKAGIILTGILPKNKMNRNIIKINMLPKAGMSGNNGVL